MRTRGTGSSGTLGKRRVVLLEEAPFAAETLVLAAPVGVRAVGPPDMGKAPSGRPSRNNLSRRRGGLRARRRNSARGASRARMRAWAGDAADAANAAVAASAADAAAAAAAYAAYAARTKVLKQCAGDRSQALSRTSGKPVNETADILHLTPGPTGGLGIDPDAGRAFDPRGQGSAHLFAVPRRHASC